MVITMVITMVTDLECTWYMVAMVNMSVFHYYSTSVTVYIHTFAPALLLTYSELQHELHPTVVFA